MKKIVAVLLVVVASPAVAGKLDPLPRPKQPWEQSCVIGDAVCQYWCNAGSRAHCPKPDARPEPKK